MYACVLTICVRIIRMCSPFTSSSPPLSFFPSRLSLLCTFYPFFLLSLSPFSSPLLPSHPLCSLLIPSPPLPPLPSLPCPSPSPLLPSSPIPSPLLPTPPLPFPLLPTPPLPSPPLSPPLPSSPLFFSPPTRLQSHENLSSTVLDGARQDVSEECKWCACRRYLYMPPRDQSPLPLHDCGGRSCDSWLHHTQPQVGCQVWHSEWLSVCCMHGRAGPGGSAMLLWSTLLSSVCACGCLTYVCTYVHIQYIYSTYTVHIVYVYVCMTAVNGESQSHYHSSCSGKHMYVHTYIHTYVCWSMTLTFSIYSSHNTSLRFTTAHTCLHALMVC